MTEPSLNAAGEQSPISAGGRGPTGPAAPSPSATAEHADDGSGPADSGGEPAVTAGSTAPDRPPSVDALARQLRHVDLPHPLLVHVARQAIADGVPGSAEDRAHTLRRSLLGPVVNATGVLLHTNLGRAPVAAGMPARPVNLEIDLHDGGRGRRAAAVSTMLCQLTGADAALVVNNGAAAVLLVLAALARDAPVVISRGELVEIGGGFRIPEVLAASGARLVEVGTTNRTRLADYHDALRSVAGSNNKSDGDDKSNGNGKSGGDGKNGGADGGGATAPGTPLVLKVHRSNYRIVGFTEEVEVGPLATLGVPVVHDIGSGLLDATTPWLAMAPPAWLAGEPAARQSLRAGAALVTFSGDKLLGGPQAGIVAGDGALVAACARHPLARALRPGGLVLAALQQTLLAYLRRDGDAITFWRMATTPVASLSARAQALGIGTAIACTSAIGGGSLPGVTLPSAGVAVEGDHTAALRHHDPPVVAMARDGRTVCDLRSVDPADDAVLAAALGAVSRQRPPR